MTDSTIPVTMSLPRNLVMLLDNAADADGRTRSAMARRILAGALANDAAPRECGADPEVAGGRSPPLSDHPSIVPSSFIEGLQRGPRMSNDAELKAAQASALAQALAADAACRVAAQQSPARRVLPKEEK